MKRILYVLLAVLLFCGAASILSADAAGEWSDWTEDTSKLNDSLYEHESKTQFSTRKKQTKTSNSPIMSGWIRDDTKTTSYISWDGTVRYYDSQQATSETYRYVDSKSVYVGQQTRLYRFCNGYDFLTWQKSGYWVDEHWVWSSGVYSYDIYHSGQDLYMSDEIKNYGSDYPCWKGETREVYKTQYGYESGTKIFVYSFYRWSDWSDWQDGSGQNSDTTRVRTVYRYRLRDNTVRYDYTYNGGTSATKTSEIVKKGAAIDLTPTAIKEGWTFVGWNTDPSAKSALSSLIMGNNDVTLYALFKQTLEPIDDGSDISIVYDRWTDHDPTIHLVVRQEDNENVVIPAVYEVFNAWDIDIEDENNNKVQPQGPVIVQIPLPDGFDKNHIIVYHKHTKTGIVELISDVHIERIREKDYIVFTTDSFSTFIIVDTTPNSPAEDLCSWCGKEHSGFFGGFVAFFHRIFARLFGQKY